MGHTHLLGYVLALLRHFSIKFNVTELFSFASHPGSGFLKAVVSCDF